MLAEESVTLSRYEWVAEVPSKRNAWTLLRRHDGATMLGDVSIGENGVSCCIRLNVANAVHPSTPIGRIAAIARPLVGSALIAIVTGTARGHSDR